MTFCMQSGLVLHERLLDIPKHVELILIGEILISFF